jgi:hypothetical protein
LRSGNFVAARLAVYRVYSGRNHLTDGLFVEPRRLFDVVAKMNKNAEPISISALRGKGFDTDVLDKVIVVEFGGDKSAFDAFYPEGYVIEGDTCLSRNSDTSTPDVNPSFR